MKVAELGEFGLIALLANLVEQRSGEAGAIKRTPRPRLEIGIGDDAAVWYSEASYHLGTTDCLIEGIHFTLGTISWYELGWKTLAVNVSDIAAMGGIPRYALVTLALPPTTEVQNVERLYEGMLDIGQRYGVTIIGGDVVRAPVAIISVTIVGMALEQRGHQCDVMRRSGALPGHLLAVTGYLGTSAAGLRMLKGKGKFSQETTDLLRQAHLRPQPRVDEGQLMVRHGVDAAIDISDGLVDDLGKLCQASRVGAQVWVGKVPIHPLVRAAFPESYLELALTGGEDYELLFTAKGELIEKIQRLLPAPVSIIGEIVREPDDEVRVMDEEGREFELERGGWDHFQASSLANE